MKLLELFKRNPCKECMYYVSTNNVCQSKKCASNSPYVTIIDRLFCEPRKGMIETGKEHYKK